MYSFAHVWIYFFFISDTILINVSVMHWMSQIWPKGSFSSDFSPFFADICSSATCITLSTDYLTCEWFCFNLETVHNGITLVVLLESSLKIWILATVTICTCTYLHFCYEFTVCKVMGGNIISKMCDISLFYSNRETLIYTQCQIWVCFLWEMSLIYINCRNWI